MRTRRILIAGAVLMLMTAGGAAAGPGRAGAADIPLSQACSGGWWTLPGTTTSEPTFTAEMSCGSHWVVFSGTATSAAGICPGDGPATVTFDGDQVTDYVTPGVASTWTLGGADGLYTVSASVADGEQWAGALANVSGLYGTCQSSASSGEVAVVSSPQSSPAPEVLACQATGAVGPNVQSGGRAGYSFIGAASGSGTCRSARGVWSLAYTGSWSESGVWGQPPSCPGGYQVTVSVADPAAGLSGSQLQEWQPSGPDNPHPMTVGSTGVEPVGAGVISQSPDACTLPATMSTSADWVFTLDS